MGADYFLGIDFGTSGVRAIAIDRHKRIQATARCEYDPIVSAPTSVEGEPISDTWRRALIHVIRHTPLEIRQQLKAIAINGTSGTVLWCDSNGTPIASPILYNDDRGQSVLGILQAIAPKHHVVLSSTSSLAKLLWWTCQAVMENPDAPLTLEQLNSANKKGDRLPSGYFLHQADWLAFLLHGKLGISDYHNSLKLGYDVEHLVYPEWMRTIPTQLALPTVLAPGTPIGSVLPTWVSQFDLAQHCQVCTGTTDSIAAFLASDAATPGEAVTSLGSTLVIKLLSTQRVEAAQYGIYSHRLDILSDSTHPPTVQWLVGGASNTGGSVLRQFFSDNELETLSDRLNPQHESPLDYYPLCQSGERFPINDPQLPPKLDPRPENKVEFLHGLLEGMARIEAKGFQLLAELGATPLRTVFTAGGGAKNAAWMAIRQRQLGVPTTTSAQTEAAFGTACLALAGITTSKRSQQS
ncbi:MAG: FGGY-family carbohydrate kinase [Cyanobacteria bacterium J06627_8]